ncbi:unnamed protein product [Aspergillus oryzae]|uniref:Unnamed protein product n=2 Tax=Aspergillus oryzae TaxID=5062 RepID=A0AAN4YDS8_ASPOZ|nr:unnamed protein product [Aspergillus oryzae]GMF89859.1 unnamed protein product [Aspergillus oryzae]GMG08103.1 unnamed protein product [Aspergillus oryzae]GMG24128.1 unnamed protein product [Aspergillus oryzae]GMG52150.1 unnamed protein product [Aspergillus oryzae var. brunneus]
MSCSHHGRKGSSDMQNVVYAIHCGTMSPKAITQPPTTMTPRRSKISPDIPWVKILRNCSSASNANRAPLRIPLLRTAVAIENNAAASNSFASLDARLPALASSREDEYKKYPVMLRKENRDSP